MNTQLVHYIDNQTVTELNEITQLLAEAYEHYFEGSDGYCKSSEGAISLHIDPYFWRDNPPKRPAIEIYSYVLGPHRNHDFANATEALEAVREWHAEEMATTYCQFASPHPNGEQCDCADYFEEAGR